jgi:5-formyltetrahydrofolate cyclo-ligase
MTDASPAEIKDRLRREALARRDGLDPAFRERASLAICEAILALPDLSARRVVGAYWPLRSEVDPRPLLAALDARGQAVALSQVVHPTLDWRLWRPGDPLVRGGFGVREPGPDAPGCSPDALLVPLAAFDRRGGRIGYGKGHFDRSIAALTHLHPVLAIGVAFALQEIVAVPLEPHDRRLDLVVTEREIIRTG